ncbi:MAG TPA: hypothetical protein VII92_01315, partial [Anaerolineae bacterium]
MNLTTALRLHLRSRVAIVGGGGKTTALFMLAREASSLVIVAATAHMAIEQTALADQHFFIHTPSDLTELDLHLPSGV